MATIKSFLSSIFAGRKKTIPKRETEIYPVENSNFKFGGFSKNRVQRRLMPPQLRNFSRTAYARRAISVYIARITELGFEIVPKHGLKPNSELKKQIEIVTKCFDAPNNDDSFLSLLTQTIEDWCVIGAACIEQQLGGDPQRPLWMWPVDSDSINIFPAWSGGNNEARYLQSTRFSTASVLEGNLLTNDELMYIRANAATDTPYGFSPVQVAYQAIASKLGVAEYANNVASNALPPAILSMVCSSTELAAFRNYWRDEIEGQGTLPIAGYVLKVDQLHAGNDEALYLKWQDFLIREIATAFNLSPQNLNLERDVNRNTSEVAEDRDLDQAIKPVAKLFQAHFTRDAIHGLLGFSNLEFRFKKLDIEDEQSLVDVFSKRYQNNSMTPNQFRKERGEEPLDNAWADLLYADMQIAIKAANEAKQVDDPNISSNQKAQDNIDPVAQKLTAPPAKQITKNKTATAKPQNKPKKP